MNTVWFFVGVYTGIVIGLSIGLWLKKLNERR